MNKQKAEHLNEPSKMLWNSWTGGLRSSGYECDMTYQQWRDMWLDSGLWDKRGRTKGSFCMKRINTKLPYSTDNCSIQLINHKFDAVPAEQPLPVHVKNNEVIDLRELDVKRVTQEVITTMARRVTNYKVINLLDLAAKRKAKEQAEAEKLKAKAERQQVQQERAAAKREKKQHGNKGRVYSPEVLERLRQWHKERAEKRRNDKEAAANKLRGD